jgi:anthraniloyl-CoA monooxygenase
LLQLLHQRCREEGVNLHFEQTIDDIQDYASADIIIASDGISSGIRSHYQQEFGTKIDLKSNRFVWLGSTKPLEAFTYFFRTTPHGMIVAHSYQYEVGKSTWIFECSNETWEKLGFEVTNETDTIDKIQLIFAAELDGHGLISNKSYWRQFPHVTNQKWFHENIVLLGDAKATAHYSIGSGTKLAMDCAIGLSDAVIANPTNVQAAFAQYEATRRNPVEMIQYAALVSLDWFENMDRNSQHSFYQFAFGCMTRSKKVTFENLQLRDTSFTQKVLAEFQKNQSTASVSPAFSNYKLRELNISNRIVMAPMGQYCAVDGEINDWHSVHYSSRALGGVGLLLAECTAVSETAKITLGCPGIYTENQTTKWKSVVDFIHTNSSSKIGIQLGHAGPKGATKLPWEGQNQPIENPWELVAASAHPFLPNGTLPIAMNLDQMDQVVDDFVRSTANADAAGFDLIELQAHHGFLLASFISPLTNLRIDEFGGSIENRMKFPIRVFQAMRAAFPAHKPMSVRVSATDWAPNGISADDILYCCEAFKQAGADIIHVSTGNTVAHQQPQLGRMWQTPFSDEIRNRVHVPTITVGSIQDIDQINTLLLNGRADLVALGKPLLANPYFVREAQAYEKIESTDAPKVYSNALKTSASKIQADRKQLEQMKRALKPKSNKK